MAPGTHGTNEVNRINGTNGAVHGRKALADHRLLATISALIFTSRPDGTWDAVKPFWARLTRGSALCYQQRGLVL